MGIVAIALASTGALALSGCAGGSTTAADGSAIITTNGSEPQMSLIPTNTTEAGGGKIITSIFAGLVSYSETGEIENEVAKSIESDGATNWTVTLNDGWTFTNDEPVTASSFVDAWNYGALVTNAQGAASFFDDIVGYSDVANTKDDPTGATDATGAVIQLPDPLAETMSGLTVVDDTTFTVELSGAEADWPLRLGYSAYSPLPAVAFEDMDAFGQNPIGNGPYELASEEAWQHDVQIELVTNPDYAGVRTPKNDGLTIVFYASFDAGYAAVQGGDLDVLDQIPEAALATYESDFPDTFVNEPAAVFQSFNMPYYLEHWSGEEGALRRAALSMAIDRAEITDVVFQGTRTPATDFTSPVIDGYSDSLKGAEVLEYNPEEAVALWAEADAISPYTGTFDIAYNSDGPHQAWVDAVANSVKNTLGIDAVGKPYPTFAASLDDREASTLTGGTRAGWLADYPSLYNFLGPLYKTGASSNYEGYSSEEFDTLLNDGAAASSVEDATAKYVEAQEVLLQDLPTIPLWYQNTSGVWSENVSNVEFGWDSVPLYHDITKNE
jgi:oligopeptide transport system substrate-binding protein